MRAAITGLLLILAASLAACASSGREMSELEKAQYAYSAAIRWGDFEGAWQLVDPHYRQAHPLSGLEFERYKQIQVSGYHDLASTSPGEGLALREVEIGVVNRNTMAERSLRYTERWRYDPEARAWWIENGLPDFWSGQ